MTAHPAAWRGSSTPPTRGAKVYKSSGAQAITGGQTAAITFDAELVDTHGLHDTGSNTNRLTIPAELDGCLVLLVANVLMSTPSTGYNIVQISRNRSAADVRLAGTMLPAVGSGSEYYSVQACDVAAAGDYYEVVVAPENNASVTHDLRTSFSLFVIGR